ncbi:hypothetical protein A2631_02640 [Candidatus Daviesbacteria bacterium RIFCSPHIGHO2_01_FULL_44_29]|uniref:Uncharacterized protein n=1 Tax=Candidatus Daviesbacteria bacterium RIFCSPHIGHO2_02_FULL_43_12 TaxID=1797776 RepID=A0A1F5KK59_9BACT|nr:MAG: hypothetical protein A2631_02640 [Candidatus Daviesbacteria bacterium RIFCSPHIGHO2_01_FULL_44_29]OGE40862.1 MAG: hypothetical protein A3E86_02710 [Candidatus Daviesbacteria bacterium RIFCSPHIGHO2_12_FULL_47_45]OGE41282.1 MAG: hypothetical protein A3D25_02035 [Candidatus Daviesbacteria bacterium RIFCSPHIGHO2_02_FULL_43_12]OGE69483.1 MAG: hypothetical protein A3B55_03775 [Candidatus Daviesbacteria bacterium RIFCSPLOWO2_01_FULL_43_15]
MSESGEGGLQTKRDLFRKTFKALTVVGTGIAVANAIPISDQKSPEASGKGAPTAAVVNKILGK